MATSTEILKQISSTISEAGKDGLEKAKELRDSARLTLEIRSRENSIQKAYHELGKAYFQAHRNDDDPEYDQIAFIKAAFEEIGELKVAKDEIRGIKRCANCGNPIADGVNYCPNCGTKYEEPEEAAEEAAEEMEEAAEEAAEEAEEEEEEK